MVVHESRQHPGYFREEFWEMVHHDMVIQGVDAHSMSDIEGFHNELPPIHAGKPVGCFS